MSRSVLPRFLLLCAVLVASSGCGGSGLATVKGTVKYKDQPVHPGTITFVSEDQPSVSGELQPDGSYELMTEKPGDGAATGTYKVIVVAMQDQANMLPEERGGLPAPTVPIKYTSLATTDLTATVESGENVFDFNLTGPLK